MSDYLTQATNFVNTTWLTKTDDIEAMLAALGVSCAAMKVFLRNYNQDPSIKKAMASHNSKVAQAVVQHADAIKNFIGAERDLFVRHGLAPAIADHYLPQSAGELKAAALNFKPQQFITDATAFQQTVCRASELAIINKDRDYLFRKVELAGMGLLGAFTVTVNGTALAASALILPALFAGVSAATLSLPMGTYMVTNAMEKWPKDK